eukprot:TRINITY_DN31702_c0_g1_i1.p1 TRINITY_DN31702_c0_g1~~TRINITY_DN31702_c0_g1_i1.p1  ORF type:complete len:263 (-),score=55.07 TRINITY_DN31702_c0_g1_i1:61-771(-)
MCIRDSIKTMVQKPIEDLMKIEIDLLKQKLTTTLRSLEKKILGRNEEVAEILSDLVSEIKKHEGGNSNSTEGSKIEDIEDLKAESNTLAYSKKRVTSVPQKLNPSTIEEIVAAMKIFYDKEIRVSNVKMEYVLKATLTQSKAEKWFSERRKRCTGSYFGKVAKSRESTDPTKLVHDVIYGTNLSCVPAIQYGIQTEKKARDRYLRYLSETEGRNISFDESGLVVDPRDHWLSLIHI